MKRNLLFFISLFLLAYTQTATAQTEKGNLMVGTQLANIGATFQHGSNVFDLQLEPSAAYFVRNNLALGAMVNFGFRAQKNAPTTFTYGIGPWARVYFSPPQDLNFSPHSAFFVDGFVGFQGLSHSKGGGSTNGLGIKVGPGISYFITKSISLDAALDYNLILGFGNATTLNSFGINLGFQIFLPLHGLREKYEQGNF